MVRKQLRLAFVTYLNFFSCLFETPAATALRQAASVHDFDARAEHYISETVTSRRLLFHNTEAAPFSSPSSSQNKLQSRDPVISSPPFPKTFQASSISSKRVIPRSQPRPTKLQNAYRALQALKKSITADPLHVTKNWIGPNVCQYYGVKCTDSSLVPTLPGLVNGKGLTVSGLDLNGFNLTGRIPTEVDLLEDLGMLHLGNNRFWGSIPYLISLKHLGELDLSCNNFSGPFPQFVLHLPALRYLDIRYNKFSGVVPRELFSCPLDVLAINDNKFTQNGIWNTVPATNASLVVMANNPLGGQLPSNLGELASTLVEIIVSGVNLTGTIPASVGQLNSTNSMDFSGNLLSGKLPPNVANLTSLVILDLSENKLSENITTSPVFSLPKLDMLDLSNNFLLGKEPKNNTVDYVDTSDNCLTGTPEQRNASQCMPYTKPPPPRLVLPPPPRSVLPPPLRSPPRSILPPPLRSPLPPPKPQPPSASSPPIPYRRGV